MDGSTVQLGGIKCSTHSVTELLDEVRVLLRDRSVRPRTILCVNAHIFNLAWSNAALRRALNEARIVAADGMAILAAARLFGKVIPERCNMTEAFRAFLRDENMPRSTGVLVGLSEEEGWRAAHNIDRMSAHCRIVKVVSGYLNETEYPHVFESLPDVDFIFIGMGTPRTERVSELAAQVCPGAIVWGIGGGTIKIFAGAMKEAPLIWRRAGLQWLYRLLTNPTTLWRRYLIGNPLFVWRVVKAAIGARRQA